MTYGGVLVAVGVVTKRRITDGCVVEAGGIP